MGIVVPVIAVGVVIAIAAWFVLREAKRLANEPPPALFDADDAFEWVVEHLPDDVAATLTEADVQRILDFQTEFFRHRGVSPNGSTPSTRGPVVVGGPEEVGYIVERAAATGESYIPEQVQGVVDTQLAYLRRIGAVGPRAEDDDREDPSLA